ncbi:TVP38/TMEM64 family protein [Paenibacillus marinisediminis]
MFKKISLAIFYIGVAYLIYIYGDVILSWVRESDHVGIVIAIATLLALFPIVPYPLVGGVIGAAYGPALGAFIIWSGSAAASLLIFLLVRYGYQEWGDKILHSHKSIDKVTVLFEKNAFVTILFSRLLPFIPSIMINTYSALSRVSFTSYAIASLIGKAPLMLLFAVVGDNLMTNPRNSMITIGTYAVFLAVTLGLHQLWKRSQASNKDKLETI